MHADELDVDVALARRLLLGQFPHWADLSLDRVEPSGTDNAIYRLGDSMSVRLPRIGWAASQPALEHAWLPRLARHLPLAIPAPLALGEPAEGYPWPWAIHTWLPGAMTNGALPGAAADLADFVAALGRIDVAGGPAAERGAPLAARDEATRIAIEACRGVIDADRAIAVWDDAVAAPVWDRPPVWIHGDLDPRNLLVERGRLTGVIDFSCMGVGDPASDVAAAWKVLTAHERGTFRSALDIDDATWSRSRGWVVSQSVIALAYYTIENNPTLVLETQRWLGEVL
jgi:aminoglycoside phosphotransferase (APT) family kinase protein